MCSKVVELRGLIIYDLTEYYKTAAVNLGKRAEPEAIEMTDSLISAAHAEGVVEGAAEEREKIRRMQLCGRRVQVSQFPDDERRNLRIETEVDGVAYTLVPTTVLAPTKEKSELTKEEYDNLFRGTFSGADAIKEKP